MKRTIPWRIVGFILLGSAAPVAVMSVLTWDSIGGPILLSWGMVPWVLFTSAFIAAAVHASNLPRRWPAEDRPHWRTSHRAVAPNGSRVAEIAQAFEHSMANPTVGTLRISDGLELQKCSPAFLWSDDSRYLAVPQWHRRFMSHWRQRLVIVDVEDRTLYSSRFAQALLLPKSFAHGKLELMPSHSFGITFGWKKKPLVLEIPQALRAFVKSGYEIYTRQS